MAVEVTFTFASAEAAIVFLGKTLPAGAATADLARKGRADKGKKRGSYKEPKAEQPAPSLSSALPESPVSESTAPVVPATAEAAQAAMEKLFAAKGIDAAMKVLATFGVGRLRELSADERANFIAKAEEASQ